MLHKLEMLHSVSREIVHRISDRTIYNLHQHGCHSRHVVTDTLVESSSTFEIVSIRHYVVWLT